MNVATLVTVRPRGRSKAPVHYVVAGVCGLHRRVFTDYAEAGQYATDLAYGPATTYALAA